MILQYTAAALASENKVLAHPASVDSVPTSANQEDHVSMGPIAARHARTVLAHVEQILAIELLVAAQALDLRDSGADGPAPGTGVAEARRRVRARVAHLDRRPGAGPGHRGGDRPGQSPARSPTWPSRSAGAADVDSSHGRPDRRRHRHRPVPS